MGIQSNQLDSCNSGTGVTVSTTNFQETIWHGIGSTVAGNATLASRLKVVAWLKAMREETDGSLNGANALYKYDGTGESSDNAIDGTVIEFLKRSLVSVELMFGDGANEPVIICTNRLLDNLGLNILESAANSIDTIGATAAQNVLSTDGTISDVQGFVRGYNADASSVSTSTFNGICEIGEFMWFQQHSAFVTHSAGFGRHNVLQSPHILSITAVEVSA